MMGCICLGVFFGLEWPHDFLVERTLSGGYEA